MLFRRRATTALEATPPALSGAAPAAPEAQSCPTLAKALDRVLKREKAAILDLGPLCGSSAVYLAGRGARVSVCEFSPPRVSRWREATEADPAPRESIAIDHASGAFDLVLAWEHLDFTPPDRLAEVAGELRRLLADGGWLLLFATNRPATSGPNTERPGRYRIVADDRIVREATSGPARPRWTHPTREIERALAPLKVQGIHLQRNQVREFLVVK
ncbi:MAG TPA: class I SAM-dependent methyltransferase [Candidatus Polarisedimenticolaceae bacterium]|nr:class I SAM-dependent methyltransferase [Candidatus Polarisedimenticolaceae bacterium]